MKFSIKDVDKVADIADKAGSLIGKAGDKISDWKDRSAARKAIYSDSTDSSTDDSDDTDNKSITTETTTTTVSDGSNSIDPYDKVFDLVTSIINQRDYFLKKVKMKVATAIMIE